MTRLAQETLGAENLYAALETLIVCKDVVAHLDSNSADQDIGCAALDAAAAAEIEQARGFFEMVGRESFIGKRGKRVPQFLKLGLGLDARENLLPNGTDESDSTVPDCFFERCKDELLITAESGPCPAPQQERPGTGIYEDLHGSSSMRSSLRIFL